MMRVFTSWAIPASGAASKAAVVAARMARRIDFMLVS
jgi:hypothetical protein